MDTRASSQDRSTRFFGTDFSIEDLEERDVNQFNYKLLGEESYDGQRRGKIESKPKAGTSSQYASSLLMIRKDIYVVVQIENFAKDKLAGRIHCNHVQKQDGIWTARTIDVFDANRGSRTVLKFET